MERVAPVVDETIRALSATKFVEDPIAACRIRGRPALSARPTNAMAGFSRQLCGESLKDSNRHRVWREDTFGVSRAADALIGSQTETQARQSSLPYGERVRSLQIDMIAYDEADQTIRAYEVKRGNGQFDAGKIRSIRRDLLCVQVLLKSYGELAKLTPIAAESRIIFYYGIRSIPKPWSLVKEELDEHFGYPVVEKVEQANAYFQSRLFALLEAA
jgi:hypothetical protein